MIKIDNNSYNIFIIGVGGTGSHLVSFLTQLIGNDQKFKEKFKITLIDGDIVEEKNLKTQKFLPKDVGLNKAEVLADRYSSVYDMEINYMDLYLTEENTLKRLIYPGTYYCNSIIVSCVDNNKARRIIDNVFNENMSKYRFHSNVIYIDTGNSSGIGDLTGQTVVSYKKDQKIILPSPSTFFPQMLEDEDEENVQHESCGEIILHNIQNIGANITSACTVFNLLNGILSFNVIPANLFTFNASKLEAESMAL